MTYTYTTDVERGLGFNPNDLHSKKTIWGIVRRSDDVIVARTTCYFETQRGRTGEEALVRRQAGKLRKRYERYLQHNDRCWYDVEREEASPRRPPKPLKRPPTKRCATPHRRCWPG